MLFLPNTNEQSRAIKPVICSATTVILQRTMCWYANYREQNRIVKSSLFFPTDSPRAKGHTRAAYTDFICLSWTVHQTIYHLWFPAALMVPAPEWISSAAMLSLSEHLQKQNQSTCSTWNLCGAITLLRDTLPYPVFPAPGLHCSIVPAHSFPLSAPPGHST